MTDDTTVPTVFTLAQEYLRDLPGTRRYPGDLMDMVSLFTMDLQDAGWNMTPDEGLDGPQVDLILNKFKEYSEND
jgi:hypothetical protein